MTLQRHILPPCRYIINAWDDDEIREWRIVLQVLTEDTWSRIKCLKQVPPFLFILIHYPVSSNTGFILIMCVC